MSAIPRDDSLDSTLSLLSEGYTFISKRCQRYQSDIFETRLMLRKVFCMMGEEASRIFYQTDRFVRQRALPPTALMLLQDKGSVALMHGEAHRRRKQMFMSLMNPEGIKRLKDTVSDQWRAHLEKWELMNLVVLHDEVQEIVCRAVCEWAGITLTDSEAVQRTHEFGAMIGGCRRCRASELVGISAPCTNRTLGPRHHSESA
jgi:fatty-acid peroxygenase